MEKLNFYDAFVLFDMEMQSDLTPLKFQRSRSFGDLVLSSLVSFLWKF